MSTSDKSKFKEYHNELDKHSKLHKEIKNQELVQQREQSAEHARTMNGVWGKPGNGAPNLSSRRRKRKFSLYNFLGVLDRVFMRGACKYIHWKAISFSLFNSFERKFTKRLMSVVLGRDNFKRKSL